MLQQDRGRSSGSSLVVVVPRLDRWYFGEVLAGVRTTAALAGVEVVCRSVPAGPAQNRCAAALLAERFDAPACLGAVVCGLHHRPEDAAEEDDRWRRRPVVAVGGSVLGLPSVLIDDVNAGATATRHLLRLGHRRVTMLSAPLTHADFAADGRRARGYRFAMREARLPSRVVEERLEPALLHAAAMRLLEAPDRPTAVVAAFDAIAHEVLDAAARLGLRVGRDLSVIGIDDDDRAAGAGLTPVAQDPQALGRDAALMLIEGSAARERPAPVRLHPTRLVSRRSSGPLAAAPARPADAGAAPEAAARSAIRR